MAVLSPVLKAAPIERRQCRAKRAIKELQRIKTLMIGDPVRNARLPGHDGKLRRLHASTHE